MPLTVFWLLLFDGLASIFWFVLFRSIPLGINGYVQFFPFHLIQMTQTEFQTSCEKGALHAAHFWLNKTKTNVTNSFKQSFKCCFRFRVILYRTVCVFFFSVSSSSSASSTPSCNFATLLLTQMLPKRINWVCVRAFDNVYGINEQEIESICANSIASSKAGCWIFANFGENIHIHGCAMCAY